MNELQRTFPVGCHFICPNSCCWHHTNATTTLCWLTLALVCARVVDAAMSNSISICRVLKNWFREKIHRCVSSSVHRNCSSTSRHPPPPPINGRFVVRGVIDYRLTKRPSTLMMVCVWSLEQKCTPHCSRMQSLLADGIHLSWQR